MGATTAALTNGCCAKLCLSFYPGFFQISPTDCLYNQVNSVNGPEFGKQRFTVGFNCVFANKHCSGNLA